MSAIYPIVPGTRWRYVGPGEGFGILHHVVSADPRASDDPGEVVTWSQPSLAGEDAGWSWLGSVRDFAKHFRPTLQ